MSIVVALIAFCGCAPTPKQTLGVWWWNLDYEPYLQFAKNNGVTEIYYCDSRFDENTASFIEKANKQGMKVFWLDGDYRWLRDDSALTNKIERYLIFQQSNPKHNFVGIHLDIEPHQDPAFSTERELLVTDLVELVHKLSQKYPTVKFDYDIPFWLDDEITFNNETLPAYAHIIKRADRTFIMSYRDTAEAIYNTAKDEAEYAVSVDKTLVLGVETYSEEGDAVSFMEEGKNYMYAELEKLRALAPENFGISVHHIKTWYNLQD